MKNKYMRDELNNEAAKTVAYGPRKDEVEDITFSENDIKIQEHCHTGSGWTHAVGYLMYAMNFPTRIELDDLINAMEIVFTDHCGKEWGAFQLFRDNLKNFLQHIDRLDPKSQDQLIDKLYYDFSLKIKKWLESGLEETPVEKSELPLSPTVQSGIDVERVATWTRKQKQTKDVQKAKERISRRKNKDNYIAEHPTYTKHDPVWRKIKPGYYRKIRNCPVCGTMLERYERFCSKACQDQDALNKNPDLVHKYFPKTKSVNK